MAFTRKFLKVHEKISDKLRNPVGKKKEGRFNISTSPVSLTLVRSSDDLLDKCRSPVIKKKKQLAFTVSELLSCTNQLKKSRLAFKLLQLCSEDEGSYSREMKLVVNTIKESLFVHKGEIDAEVLMKVYEKYTDAVFAGEEVPVVSVNESLNSLLSSYKSKNKELNDFVSQLNSDSKNSLAQKDLQIETLQKFIESNISQPLKEKDLEIKNLEERYSSACKSIDELKEIIETNEVIVRKLRLQNSNNTKSIYNYQCEEEKFKFIIEELNKNISKLQQENRSLQEENYKKQYYLEITLMKIKAAIDREKFLEARNSDLEQENQKLSEIFGNGSNYLTPRPSFQGLNEIFHDLPNSTQGKVRKLMNLALLHLKNKKSRPSLRKFSTLRNSSKSSSKHELSSRLEEKDSNIIKS